MQMHQDNSATASLVAAGSVGDRQRSSGQPATAGASPASRLTVTGLLQRRTPSKAQAIPFCMVVSSSIDIPTRVYFLEIGYDHFLGYST
jgi:hypothetical protein